MHRAASLLARRPYCRAELRSRLSPHGSLEDLEDVLNRLEELNLLNDADYAYNFAGRSIRDGGLGPQKVRDLLLRRGVDGPTVEAALDRVRTEVGDADALRRYLARRFQKRPLPENEKSIYQLVKHLQRRGFAEDTIARVLRTGISSDVAERLDAGD
jgi:regulatory protein